jgi:hypothetical protein
MAAIARRRARDREPLLQMPRNLRPLYSLALCPNLDQWAGDSSVIGCMRCDFVCGPFEQCVANRFAHHPPKVQLNIIHVLLHEIEIVRPSNVKGFTIVVGVEDTAFSAREGVDCNLWINSQQSDS